MFVSQGKLSQGEFGEAFEVDRIAYSTHLAVPLEQQARAKRVIVTIMQEQGLPIASIDGLGKIEQLRPHDYVVSIAAGHIRAYEYRNDPPKTKV
jgi:hypothetical protein